MKRESDLTETSISFVVPGRPAQQGSKNLIPAHKNRSGRAVMIESGRGALTVWRETAEWTMRKYAPVEPIVGPVWVIAFFCYRRPKSHFTAAGRLKPSAPIYKHSTPDLDKLQRALGDCLTRARIITDDALIVCWHARKMWAEIDETRITIEQEPT